MDSGRKSAILIFHVAQEEGAATPQAGSKTKAAGLPSPSWCCTLTASPAFFRVIHLRDSKSVARRHLRQAPHYYEISGVGRDSYVRVRPDLENTWPGWGCTIEGWVAIQ